MRQQHCIYLVVFINNIKLLNKVKTDFSQRFNLPTTYKCIICLLLFCIMKNKQFIRRKKGGIRI